MKKYLVYLNVFSALAVVILHTNFVFWQFSYEPYWISANIIESLFYFAVPIFVMITGANLIGYSKKYSTLQYIDKRVEKTVIPFLVWTGIAHVMSLFKSPMYLSTLTISVVGKQLKWIIVVACLIMLYSIVKKLAKNEILTLLLKMISVLIGTITIIKIFDSQSGTVWEILNNIFHAKYQGVYWYFIPLFALYIAIPMFEGIPEEARQKVFGSIISITFVFGFLVIFTIQFIPNMSYNTNLVLPFQTYVWYALVGYYIDNYTISKMNRYIIYVLGLLGLSMHLFGTQLLSLQQGAISVVFKEYLNVPTMLYATAIFVFFKYLPDKIYQGVLWRLNLAISKTTFGVYLIHILIIEILKVKTTLDFKQVPVRLIVAILIFIMSSLLVLLYTLVAKRIKQVIKRVSNNK